MIHRFIARRFGTACRIRGMKFDDAVVLADTFAVELGLDPDEFADFKANFLREFRR